MVVVLTLTSRLFLRNPGKSYARNGKVRGLAFGKIVEYFGLREKSSPVVRTCSARLLGFGGLRFALSESRGLTGLI